MLCEKCGKEVNLDPTEETECDGMECPDCGSILCHDCAKWELVGDQDVCSKCAENARNERAKFERQDFVDNTIHEMLKTLNPSKVELKWDIHPISEIRDAIVAYFVDELKICTPDEFYP
jgi:DNA-directed RNA polymerase subunit RPC12/RpoP